MTSFGGRVSPYYDVVRFSSFRTLLIGQGLSMAGDAVCLAALPVAMIHAGFGGEILGLVLAAVGLGTVIGAAAGGLLADRKSPKHVLIATDAARGLAQVIVVSLVRALGGAMVLLGMGGSAWMAILGATLVGVVEGSWLTGCATAMQILSPEKDLGKVVAMDTLITSGAHPFVYLGGGIVGGAIGYSNTLIIAAIVSTLGTVAIGVITVKRKQPSQ